MSCSLSLWLWWAHFYAFVSRNPTSFSEWRSRKHSHLLVLSKRRGRIIVVKYAQNMFSLLKTKIKTVLGRWLCQCFILYCLWKNISIISQPSVPTREEGLETLTVTIQGHKSTKWLRFNHKIIEHLPPPCLTCVTLI